MKNIFYKIFLSILIIFFSCGAAESSELYKEKNVFIQNILNAEINWTAMTLRAVGSAELEPKNITAADFTPEEAAISEAKGKLLEALKEVPITSSYYFEDLSLLSEGKKKAIQEAVDNARIIVKAKVKEDNTLKVIAEIRLNGTLLDMAYPAKENLPIGKGKLFKGKGIYSSIIFDARNANFSPILLPKIIDDKGEAYYELNKDNRYSAINNGYIRYFSSLDAAKRDIFAGRKPYIISIVKENPDSLDTLIVPSKVLNKVRNEAFYSEILRNCKVIIILNEVRKK